MAKHLKSLGANVEFTSVLGKDDKAKYVLEQLKKSKIKSNIIFDELNKDISPNKINGLPTANNLQSYWSRFQAH